MIASFCVLDSRYAKEIVGSHSELEISSWEYMTQAAQYQH